MPTASAELANKVRIYIGQTTSTYTSGQSYQCIEDPENAGVYIWEPTASKVTVDNVTIQENASGQLETVVKIWNGSSAEWEALSSAEKSKWTVINITDDAEDTSTIEARIQTLTNTVNTNTGNIADNANDIQTLTNTVNTNSDNIANDNDEYNPNHNYVAGEYCISPDDGTLQKCVVATSGGSWATVKNTCFTKDSLANAVKTLNSGLNKYPEYTVIFDNTDLSSPILYDTTTIPGLGYFNDWDELIFICRANTITDVYMFTDKIGQHEFSFKSVPYIQFTGWAGSTTNNYISTIRFWGGSRDVLGIAVQYNNVNWRLGLVALVGVKYKA
jgi:hypothetical protein